MGGGAKMLWVLFVIILPFLGCLHLPHRAGRKIRESAAAQAAQQQQAFDATIKARPAATGRRAGLAT